MKSYYLLFLMLILSIPLFAQFGGPPVPIELYEQFNGRMSFTAIGNTLNPNENNDNPGGDLELLDMSSANFALTPNQTLVAAYLYWAGAGPFFDTTVDLNGIEVESSRTFVVGTPGRFAFGGFADVTAIVQAIGNGVYTFSELDLGLPPYTYNGTKFGGWSIIAVYEDPSLTLNQVSIFDGFQILNNEMLEINFVLDNLNITSTMSSKLAFLAWEGDYNNNTVSGEVVLVNNFELTNAINPSGNVFNSTNSFTGDYEFFNVDHLNYSRDD